MTTVNTFDDILEILDRHPDYREALRQRILDEEHRRLPERIDRAVKAVEELAQTVSEFVQRTNGTLAQHEARLERLEGQIADLQSATDRVLETVADILNRLAKVETTVETLADVPERLERVETKVEALADVPERLERVETKVEALADVPERLANVESQVADIPDIKNRQEEMATTMATMQGQMDTMQGQLNNLTGTDYERRIVRRSRGLAQRYLSIKQARLLQAISLPDDPTIPNLLQDAVASGVITYEQADDVDDADLILLGNTADDLDSYVLAEVSITIDDHDVDRAQRRAAALSAAAGAPVVAAVIGTNISDANRERANDSNVAIIMAAARNR